MGGRGGVAGPAGAGWRGGVIRPVAGAIDPVVVNGGYTFGFEGGAVLFGGTRRPASPPRWRAGGGGCGMRGAATGGGATCGAMCGGAGGACPCCGVWAC
jgi:hypothetical protein